MQRQVHAEQEANASYLGFRDSHWGKCQCISQRDGGAERAEEVWNGIRTLCKCHLHVRCWKAIYFGMLGLNKEKKGHVLFFVICRSSYQKMTTECQLELPLAGKSYTIIIKNRDLYGRTVEQARWSSLEGNIIMRSQHLSHYSLGFGSWERLYCIITL